MGKVRLLFILFAALVLTGGCDRGEHPGQIGTKAPQFTINSHDQTLRLADYRGRIVVLNFWASWCAPCIEEFPSMVVLQQQMPQIAVVAISFNDEYNAYKAFVAENHLSSLTTIFDTTQKSNLAFGTTRPPETYIIDRKGIIRRKFIGPQNWTSPEIESYLRSL